MRQMISILLAGSCLASCATAPPSPSPERRLVFRELEDFGEVIGRIEGQCPTRFSAALDGAAAAVNAMPERAGHPPVVVGQELDDFLESYGDAMGRFGGDPHVLTIAAIDGAVGAIDATSSYMDREEFREVATRGRAASIGVRLGRDDPAPVVVRVEPPAGPADRAGLRRGDRLVSVDGQSTAGMELDDVVDLLRGEEGSTVALSIERGAAAPIPLKLQREILSIPSVRWRTEERLGIITIASFDEQATDAAEEAIAAIQREIGAPQGYVVDVRWNSGGLLDQIISVADLFLDGGEVLVVSGLAPCGEGNTVADRYSARSGDLTGGAPVVLLVNQDTASGAELFAAALMERGRARAVGQPTYGVSDVHTVIPIRGGRGGALKLTTGKLLTPGGRAIDGAGVEPGVVTPEEDDDRDHALERALELLGALATAAT